MEDLRDTGGVYLKEIYISTNLPKLVAVFYTMYVKSTEKISTECH